MTYRATLDFLLQDWLHVDQLTGRSRKELYERALALAPPKPGE